MQMKANAGVVAALAVRARQDMELSNRDVKQLRDDSLRIYAASRHTHTMRPS